MITMGKALRAFVILMRTFIRECRVLGDEVLKLDVVCRCKCHLE